LCVASIEREQAMYEMKRRATSLAAVLSVLILCAAPAAQAADGNEFDFHAAASA